MQFFQTLSMPTEIFSIVPQLLSSFFRLFLYETSITNYFGLRPFLFWNVNVRIFQLGSDAQFTYFITFFEILTGFAQGFIMFFQEKVATPSETFDVCILKGLLGFITKKLQSPQNLLLNGSSGQSGTSFSLLRTHQTYVALKFKSIQKKNVIYLM